MSERKHSQREIRRQQLAQERYRQLRCSPFPPLAITSYRDSDLFYTLKTPTQETFSTVLQTFYGEDSLYYQEIGKRDDIAHQLETLLALSKKLFFEQPAEELPHPLNQPSFINKTKNAITNLLSSSETWKIDPDQIMTSLQRELSPFLSDNPSLDIGPQAIQDLLPFLLFLIAKTDKATPSSSSKIITRQGMGNPEAAAKRYLRKKKQKEKERQRLRRIQRNKIKKRRANRQRKRSGAFSGPTPCSHHLRTGSAALPSRQHQ